VGRWADGRGEVVKKVCGRKEGVSLSVNNEESKRGVPGRGSSVYITF
jgi:hypothetical protein